MRHLDVTSRAADHNEALFREVNAHIVELEERSRVGEGLLPLICECANTGCTTIIEVEHGTFEGRPGEPAALSRGTETRTR